MESEFNPDQNQESTTSKLSEVYSLLGAHSPLEMSRLYTAEDQKLMKSGEWDYDDSNALINKVKTLLEEIDLESLSQEELEWRNEILWFWYHHAISCAFRKQDKEAARRYAQMALDIQPEKHPNKITRLLYYLVNDMVTEAEEWSSVITKEPEKSTATDLLKYYKTEGFFH